MPAKMSLPLTEAETTQLQDIRDHDPLPYRRERAAALLKIAGGCSERWVAAKGLLRPRSPDTVQAWVQRYKAQGVAGLSIHPGRGRKPVFSPGGPDGRPGAHDAARSAAHRSPHAG